MLGRRHPSLQVASLTLEKLLPLFRTWREIIEILLNEAKEILGISSKNKNSRVGRE